MAKETVLNTNLVLVGVELLPETDMIGQFRTDFGPDLRVESGLFARAPGITEPARIMTLGEDRIQLRLHASRSIIGREYPDKSGFAKLARVASRAIELTNSKAPNAFGYNMDLVFEQDSGQPALQYLGNRLYGHLFLDDPGRKVVGGTGKLIISDTAGTWTISAEPRFEDSDTSLVFVSLNLHKQEQRFPDETEINRSLEKIQQEARAFESRLGGVIFDYE